MNRTTLLAGSALALAFGFGIASVAQSQNRVTPVSTVTGTTQITDTIDDLEERTLDNFEESRDEARFGSAAVPEGFRGGIFASGSATSGNTDTLDFGLGLRATIGQGRLNHTFGAAVEYGEDEETRNENRIFAIYDLNYDITDRFYAFGLARAQYDEFASIEQDYFLGAGPGYRVFNEPDLAWRLQAGPGVRYTKDQLDNEETEFAGILSSRLYYQISEQAFITNDTDLLASEVDYTVANDLAVNVALTGPFSLRTALRTEYSSDPLPGLESTDNTISAALVYTFR